MKESDQLVTSFITPFGLYCYVSMHFGLKNAGATYQRCMLKCFGNLIREIVEAYMDDIVVKSKKADQPMADLKKLSRNSEKTTSNSIPKSAFSGSRGVCCSGSSSLSTASMVEPSESYGPHVLTIVFQTFGSSM
jgi:hypothetical protein